MDHTSVYLTDEDVARLTALAAREATSRAEVIRRAIRAYEPRCHGDRSFTLVGCTEGPGGSAADVAEAELAPDAGCRRPVPRCGG